MTAKPRPTSATLLAALPVMVLDLETTGLDVRRDRVIQIGLVAMHGLKILDDPRIDQLINPGVPIPAASTRIHHIRDEDVAGAPSFAAFASQLHDLLQGSVVVGHHVAFDLAVLRHEAARAGIAWHDPPSLDLALLVGALEPSIPDLGLETVTSMLGVAIEGRHSASGDCMAAAQAFERLLPRLREADVRTLGEAQSFSALRDDLLRRQAESGWDAIPGQAPVAHPPPALPRIDSFVFERRIDDVMSAPPVMVGPETTLRAAARLMVERRIGAMLIGTADAPPLGILTERDLLRTVADGGTDLDAAPVSRVMTAQPQAMRADEMLYRALGRMDRLGIRHLCVVDDAGVAVGMISQRDLLHHRARAAVALGDGVSEAGDLAALAASYSTVPEVAQRLVAEGLAGPDVARVVSEEVRSLTARAAHITIDRLRADGRGDAPAPWCLLVLGSGGRGESLLGADQDNALIHAGTAEHDEWFAALGAGIADLLDTAGVPRCNGGVMAANAPWRGTLGDWSERVRTWLRRSRPEDLLTTDIFFDLVAVAGEPSLARDLHADAVHAASRAPTFLSLLAESVGSVTPRFGMFGRLRVDDGRVDLKRDGLLPLVSFARTVALRVGSRARSTPDRLRDAAGTGRLSERDASALIAIHAQLLTLILRQQLIDIDEGVRPSSRVRVKILARDEQAQLARHLHQLDDIVREVRSIVSQ